MQLPRMTPGNDSTSSEPMMCQSTVPIIQCPAPAMSVSGTAWAISEPTMLTIGSLGYKMIKVQAPMAPAPTEETGTISNGVISDPPPTPVMPTRTPTPKPESEYGGSIIMLG